jgi:hypothetical protein
MIRCDRQSPCSPCTKANLQNCLYVCEDRDDLAKAPFEARETQFSVLEQTLEGLVACPPAAPTAPVPHTEMNVQPVLLPNQHEPFDVAFQDVYRPLDPSSFDMPLSLDTPSWDFLLQTDASITKPRVTVTVPLYPSLSSAPVGAFYKSRFLAQSHWINYAHQVSGLNPCVP